MLSQVLFQPKVSNLLTRLDDSHSMFSIATRDFVDNTGRTVMEYKRDPHGGRERLIEDFLTTLVWGFGIGFLKTHVYDPLVKKFTAVQFPDIEMDMLNKWHAQELNAAVFNKIDGLVNAGGASGARAKVYQDTFQGLKKLVVEDGLKSIYHVSNVSKFFLCTAIPTLIIALGIPTFNQWLTRGLAAKEKAHAQPAPAFAGGFSNMSLQKPQAFRQFDTLQHRHKHPGLKFGGFGSTATNVVSGLLQNEQHNSLIIDGILSTGRVYKARNWVEKLEITFKEASIIFFLFFAQRPIQTMFEGLFDKLASAVTGLEFNTMKTLYGQFSGTGRNFSQEFSGGLSHLVEQLSALNPSLNQAGNLGEILKNPSLLKQQPKLAKALETTLAEVVRDYMFTGQSGNLILETALSSGRIKSVASKEHGLLLDLTKKIPLESVLEMVGSLEKMAIKNGVDGFEALIKRSMVGKTGAWLAANAVCALFLSYLCPKIQHWMTYKLTGTDHFPGLDPK